MHENPEHGTAPFSETLSSLMQQAQVGSQRLSKLTGIPRTSIDSWRAGTVRRPQHWQPLLKVARALALKRHDLETLLAAAGHPPLDTLIHDIAHEHPDRDLLRPWLDLPSAGTQEGIERRLQLLEAQLAADAAHARAARHQLRAPIDDFAGREQEAGELVTALRAAHARQRGAIIIGVQGMVGAGKTELAVLVANRLIDAFPDAQIFVPLRGTRADPLSAAQALRQVIHAFTPDVKLPNELDALQAHYRSVLHGLRALILADDARDADHVRPLIPPQGSALLITSRTRFTLPGMTAVQLGQLTEAEAGELLRRICPRLSVAESRAIAQACGCLPLALRISGGILYNTPAMPVADYLARLGDERQRLLQLRDPHEAKLDVETSLRLSYTQLDGPTQQVFRQLGIMVADFAMPLARAVVVAPAGVDVEATLYLLLRCSLVIYDAARARWRLHDLVRDLARRELEDAGELEAAAWRYARAAVQVLLATHEKYLAGGSGVRAALSQFDTERPHIDAAQRWAAIHAGTPVGDTLLAAEAETTHYIDMLRYDQDHERILLEGPRHARRNGGRRGEGQSLVSLGTAYNRLGAAHQVLSAYEQALAMVREIGDRHGEGVALISLGLAYANLGEPQQAIVYSEQALAIMREVGDRHGEGVALNNQGCAYLLSGDAERALDACEQALEIAREIGDQRGEGYTLIALGRAYAALGSPGSATARFMQARSVFREIGDRSGTAECSWYYGLFLADQGDHERAVLLLRACVAYEERTGHTKAAEHAAVLARLEAREAVLADMPHPAE